MRRIARVLAPLVAVLAFLLVVGTASAQPVRVGMNWWGAQYPLEPAKMAWLGDPDPGSTTDRAMWARPAWQDWTSKANRDATVANAQAAGVPLRPILICETVPPNCGDYIRSVVNDYPQIERWQVDTEPQYRYSSPQAWGSALKWYARTIHGASREAKNDLVDAGGVAMADPDYARGNWRAWTDQSASAPGIYAIGIHPYSQYSVARGDPRDAGAESARRANEVDGLYARPVTATEVGFHYCSALTPPGKCDNPDQAPGEEWQRQQWATFIHDWQGDFAVWVLQDLNTSWGGGYGGVRRDDGSPRPAWSEVARATQ